MNRMTETSDWIGAYLEWTDAGSISGAREQVDLGGMQAVGADVAQEFTAAYLEWMDAARPGRKRRARYRVRGAGDSSAQTSGADVFREALLVALRTESDCIQFLRQILDAGGTSTRTLGFAHEALQHAERLLEDERRAWRELTARYPWDVKRMSPASRVEMEMTWPRALEDVAADVHALRDTIQALQSH